MAPHFFKERIMSSVTIDVRRSSYHIYPYKEGDSPQIQKYLSVYDIYLRKYTHPGYNIQDDTLKIPISVELDDIVTKLSNDGIEIKDVLNNKETYHKYRHIEKLSCSAKPRNKVQYEAVKFLLAENETDKNVSQRLLTLDTGFGKTVCTIMATINLKMPIMITSVYLTDQWIERILEFTDGRLGVDIIHIKNKDMMVKLLNKKSKRGTSATFYMIGLDAMISAIKFDTTLVDRFIEKMGIGVQVFDESHEHFLKIINVVNNINVYRIILLSATPERARFQEDKLYGKLFRNHIPSYGEDTHHVNKFNILRVEMDTRPSEGYKRYIQTRRGVSISNYFNYIKKSPYKVNMFANIIMYLVYKIFSFNKFNPTTKCLVYIQDLALIRIIIGILRDGLVFPNGFKPSLGNYTNSVKKSEKELQLNRNVIFTTISKRTGLDIEGLKMVITFIPVSSAPIVRQMRGRIRDKDGWFVDVVDLGFPGMVAQGRKRMKMHERVANRSVTYIYDHKISSVKPT